jgi:hypothetical protein
MICPYCGKENPEKISQCEYCGGGLFDTDDRKAPQPPPYEVPSPPEPQSAEAEHTEDQLGVPPEVISSNNEAMLDQPATAYNPENVELPQTPAKRTKGGWEKYIWWMVGCFVFLCLAISCGVLIWGFYNFSSVLDFTKPATQTPSILFSDDFSDPDSGWPRFNEADYVDDYFNGAYRMVENLDNTTSWVYPGEYSFSDVIIAVDATKNGGPDENDMGVICRFQDDDHFYFGLVTSDGYYGLIKMLDGEFSVLGSEYLEASDFINPGSATNNIRMECIGDTLTLFANGQKLTQQTDTDYDRGNVGLIIGTYDTPGTDILFDNFTVQQP